MAIKLIAGHFAISDNLFSIVLSPGVRSLALMSSSAFSGTWWIFSLLVYPIVVVSQLINLL